MAGPFTGVLEASYQASAAVDGKRFVVLTGDETVARASVIGEMVLGVAMNDIHNNVGVADTNGRNEITDGKATAVHLLAAPLVEAGAAITRKDRIITDASGRAIPWSAPGVGVTHHLAGIALKGAAAAGELIPVLLTPGGHQATG